MPLMPLLIPNNKTPLKRQLNTNNSQLKPTTTTMIQRCCKPPNKPLKTPLSLSALVNNSLKPATTSDQLPHKLLLIQTPPPLLPPPTRSIKLHKRPLSLSTTKPSHNSTLVSFKPLNSVNNPPNSVSNKPLHNSMPASFKVLNSVSNKALHNSTPPLCLNSDKVKV